MWCKRLNFTPESDLELQCGVLALTGCALGLASGLLGQLYAAQAGLALPFLGQALLGLALFLPLTGAGVALVCAYSGLRRAWLLVGDD